MKKFIIVILSLSFLIFIFMYICYISNNYKKYSYFYLKDFLTEKDFFTIQEECKKYNCILENDQKVDENIYTTKRKNMELNNKIVRNILNKDIYKNKIRELTDNYNIYLARNFPIEYRKYSKGSFMKRHSDTLIYSIPQYECVLTLSNTSDCKTVFYDEEDYKQIKSLPNSIIIVRAKGIEHEVLTVTEGERYFLKFIFTETDELL